MTKLADSKQMSKDHICESLNIRIGFWRQNIDEMEQYLADLQKADEETVLLAHNHDTKQVEIEGETTTIRELAANLGMDLDTLQALRNQSDDHGFGEWLDVPFTLASDHVGAIHQRQINTDEGHAHSCHAYDGKFFRYNGRFDGPCGQTWFVNTIDPHHELDVWTTGF